MNMSKHGELTAEIGKNLKLEGYDVFYDHGEPGPSVGKIVSSLDKAPAMGEELSQLDIAIIKKTTNKAVALIEIEETTDTPKTFLGDIFGILMGKSISFKGNSSGWKIGNWTTLIIIGNGKNHEKRNEHLREMALKAKSTLGTENSQIGSIVIKTFSDGEKLPALLLSVLDRVFRESNKLYARKIV
jgi:hypothetical protein